MAKINWFPGHMTKALREMEEEAKELLQQFFKEIRLKKKQQDD